MLIPTRILPLCILLQALDKPGSMVVFPSICNPQYCVNRQGTTAFGAFKSDEPPLAAAATPCQTEVSLVNNTESSVILGFIEGTILQQKIKTPLLVFLFT